MAEPLLDSSMTPAEAFKAAVGKLNGQSATARVLKVSQQAISAKLKADKPCSPKWAIPLEAASGIAKEQLRPDIYPPESQPAAPAQALGDMEPAR